MEDNTDLSIMSKVIKYDTAFKDNDSERYLNIDNSYKCSYIQERKIKTGRTAGNKRKNNGQEFLEVARKRIVKRKKIKKVKVQEQKKRMTLSNENEGQKEETEVLNPLYNLETLEKNEEEEEDVEPEVKDMIEVTETCLVCDLCIMGYDDVDDLVFHLENAHNSQFLVSQKSSDPTQESRYSQEDLRITIMAHHDSNRILKSYQKSTLKSVSCPNIRKRGLTYTKEDAISMKISTSFSPTNNHGNDVIPMGSSISLTSSNNHDNDSSSLKSSKILVHSGKPRDIQLAELILGNNSVTKQVQNILDKQPPNVIPRIKIIYVCQYCEKVFDARGDLVKHVNEHEKQKTNVQKNQNVVTTNDKTEYDHSGLGNLKTGRNQTTSAQKKPETMPNVKRYALNPELIHLKLTKHNIKNTTVIDNVQDCLNKYPAKIHPKTKGNLMCEFCEESFQTHDGLCKHKEMHKIAGAKTSGTWERNETCIDKVHAQSGPGDTKRNKNLNIEVKSVSGLPRFRLAKDNLANEQRSLEKAKANQRKLICMTCSEVFPDLQSISRHLSVSHPFACQVQPFIAFESDGTAIDFKNQALESNMSPPRNHKPSEQKMNRGNQTAKGQTYHSKTVAGLPTLTKDMLADEVGDPKNLDETKASQGTFICMTCSNVFPNLHSMSRHLSVSHPFACQTCGARFSQNFGLANHMKCHKTNLWLRTKVRPFIAFDSDGKAIDFKNQAFESSMSPPRKHKPSEQKRNRGKRTAKGQTCHHRRINLQKIKETIKIDHDYQMRSNARKLLVSCPVCSDKISTRKTKDNPDFIKRSNQVLLEHIKRTHKHLKAKFKRRTYRLQIQGDLKCQGKEIICVLCSGSFRTSLNLQVHLSESLTIGSEETKSGNFKCDVCDRKFMSKCGLTLHRDDNHYVDVSYDCCHCKNQGVEPNVKLLSSEIFETIKCQTCQRDLAVKITVDKTADEHHQGTGIKILTKTCPAKKPCPKKQIKLQHLRSQGPNQEERIHVGKMSKEKDKDDDKYYGHKYTHPVCNICDEHFPLYTKMKYHMLTAHHQGEPHKACHTCKKSFSHPYQYKRHMATHRAEKKFKCVVCGKFYKTRHALKQHEVVHSDVRQFKCETKQTRTYTAKKQQTNKAPINQETKIQNKHDTEKEKLHICIVCRERFKDWDKFQEHKYVHRVCHICKKVFSLYSQMNYHVMVAHYPGEPRNACHTCKKSFRLDHIYKNHMASHSAEKNFICEVCGKFFLTKHLLKQHEVVHSEVRPFKCHLCERAFKRKSELRQHMEQKKGHGGARRPYKCRLCEKTYGTITGLRFHVKHTHVSNDILKSDMPKRKYSCKICSKMISTSAGLGRHMDMHYGKKYPCPICGRGYSDKVYIPRHIKLVHKGPGRKARGKVLWTQSGHKG